MKEANSMMSDSSENMMDRRSVYLNFLPQQNTREQIEELILSPHWQNLPREVKQRWLNQYQDCLISS
jgi:hypothetical protein